MPLKTVFLAYASADHDFASQLSAFLEFGCDVTCCADGGFDPSNEDLLDKAEDGLNADIVVLLLSKDSCAVRWPRERWEPILIDQPKLKKVELASLALNDCHFPVALRKLNFFDGASSSHEAMRLLKRWLWQRGRDVREALHSSCSSDLEDLYLQLADRGGELRVDSLLASRFAKEAGQEFEFVLWIPAFERSLAQVAGEIGRQLQLVLEGPAEENCRQIQSFLSGRRGLLVLDAPQRELVDAVIPHGRTSTIVTSAPVKRVESPESIPYARSLVVSGCYAEAYELFYRLLQLGVAPENCARELIWICELWNRPGEADSLRHYLSGAKFEQLALF